MDFYYNSMRYKKHELQGNAQTVLGPISVDELGITLCHEHCLFDGTCDFVEPKEKAARKIANEPLSFKNVSYEVKSSTGSDTLRLLNNVSGVFRAGRMCALMGEVRYFTLVSLVIIEILIAFIQFVYTHSPVWCREDNIVSLFLVTLNVFSVQCVSE